MDALVIACATREHVNLLNNESALSGKRYDLQNKLRNKKAYFNKKENKEKEAFSDFKKPWKSFTVDAKNELEKIVISFKQNLRVINKATNYYESYKDEEGNLRIGKDGKPQKGIISQKGTNWAIRKSLHVPMPYGKKIYDSILLKIINSIGNRHLIIDEFIKEKIEKLYLECNSNISEVKKRLKEYPVLNEVGNPIEVTAFRIKTEKFRKRQPISKLSNRGQGGIKSYDDAVKYINKVADFKLREDLLLFLETNNNDIDIAFSPEGIDKFNENREFPIYKLPIAESGIGRFALGDNLNTKHKYVEADKGTNLYFTVYRSIKNR